MEAALQLGTQLIWPVSVLAAAIFVGLVAHGILFAVLRKVARRRGSPLANSLVLHGEKPGRLILPFVALLAALPLADLPVRVLTPLERGVGLALIAAVAWLVVLSTEVISDLVSTQFHVGQEDTPTSRRIHTQVLVLQRIVTAVVVVVALAVMLMTFPAIKHIGLSLLASAGLAGLIVGMAMKDTLGNLIAGFQVAFTEMIRIDDVVVVKGEWGWIEEIATTYVVVRIWDLRRLVVPLSYFMTNPYENWSRQGTNLLGTVTLNVDYSVPVEEVRRALERIVKTTKDWKGEVCVLQVTDADEKSSQIRALVDARDSDSLWNLRCYVREKLIQFLQENYPQALPKVRAELAGIPAEEATHAIAMTHNTGGGFK